MDVKTCCFLPALLAFSIIFLSANGQTRPNDTAEIIFPTINTTKQWTPVLVPATNPIEEDILKSERNRENTVSNLGKKSSEEDDDAPPTPQPDDEGYEGDHESPHLEDILNMERNREFNLNGNPDKLPFQESSDFSNLDFVKQGNGSSMNSPIEEGIVGAENDRDDSMTNIFRSGGSNEQMREYGSDYKSVLPDRETDKHNDGPKFEFLIGAAPVQMSTSKVVSEEIIPTRKPFVPPKSAWPVPQAQFLTTEPKYNSTNATPVRKAKASSVDIVEDYVELVEVAKNVSMESSGLVTNKSLVFGAVGNGNRSEHFVENDGSDSCFTDLQTLFLALFATLVPLFIILLLACGLRLVWRRYRRGGRRGVGYGSGLRSEAGGSQDPITDKRDQSNDLKSAESGFSNRDGESKELTGNCTSPTQQNQPANGSIITMTLKNNHLIVETEMRNDIIQGSRETKMKYSANNNGVFVVEVQQSDSHSMANTSPERRALVHHSPITNIPSSIVEESQESLDAVQPPPNKQHFGSTNTGLSTSDLSLSSSGSHNPSYSYGNQTGYEQGQYGYPIYAGYIPPPVTSIPYESSREPLLSKTPTDNDKPVVTAAIFKQDSMIVSEDVMKSGEYNIEGSTDGPLLSDIQAREKSLHILQDKIIDGGPKRIIANSDSVPTSDNEDDKFQEQQRQLGNGHEQTVVEINHDKSGHPFYRADSLPPRLIHEQMADAPTNNMDNFDIIEEETSMDCYPGDIASGSPLLCHSAGIAAANARHKRASLPIITPDLYSTIKQTTKSILPTLSPKFEKLSNENSPMDSCERQSGPPLITVTEEADGVDIDGNESVQG